MSLLWPRPEWGACLRLREIHDVTRLDAAREGTRLRVGPARARAGDVPVARQINQF